METCTGIKDKFSCKYCQKQFNHDKSRFNHYKICKSKQEYDTSLIIPESDKPSIINNNIQNQNNTNIIIIIMTDPSKVEFLIK
jgi:hypothetical protein